MSHEKESESPIRLFDTNREEKLMIVTSDVPEGTCWSPCYLSIGTVLFTCFPTVIFPQPNYINSVCNYCYKRFDSLLRCSKCRLVRYCSKECQRLDWLVVFHSFSFFRRVHRLECLYLSKIRKLEDEKVIYTCIE